MTRLTPRPAAPPPNRRSLPPQPSSPDSGPRTNAPRLPQGTVSHRDPHQPRPSQHGFPCGLRHPPPHRPESAVLRRLRAGPADHALEGGLCPGPLSQLPQLCVGPALPPRSMGGAVALGGGVSMGVGVCGGVMGTGGGGGPGGVLVVLCRGGASVREPVGTRKRIPLRGWVGIREGGGSGASPGCGQTSGASRGAGSLLVGPGVAPVQPGVVRGPGVRVLSGGGMRCAAPRPWRVLLCRWWRRRR